MYKLGNWPMNKTERTSCGQRWRWHRWWRLRTWVHQRWEPQRLLS